METEKILTEAGAYNKAIDILRFFLPNNQFSIKWSKTHIFITVSFAMHGGKDINV